jgi:hypothetical protein
MWARFIYNLALQNLDVVCLPYRCSITWPDLLGQWPNHLGKNGTPFREFTTTMLKLLLSVKYGVWFVMDKMDHVVTLSDILRQVVRTYATHGYNMAGQPMKLYFVENPQEQVFAVLGPYDPGDRQAEIVMMARIVNDLVIIDFDKSSKPLFSALKRAGIPESQIVFAAQQTR